MFDYIRTQATATRLIERFGLPVSLSKLASTYDPATGAATSTAATSSTLGLFVEIEQAADAVEQSGQTGTGSSVRQVGMVVIAAMRPDVGDRLTADGKTFDVLMVEPIAPAGLPVMYRLRLKAN
jgi:hypothetical protein